MLKDNRIEGQARCPLNPTDLDLRSIFSDLRCEGRLLSSCVLRAGNFLSQLPPTSSQGVLQRPPKASTDVYVTISSMYEVVIGGWGNTKSGIRRCSQGELVCCVNEGLHNAHIYCGECKPSFFGCPLTKTRNSYKLGPTFLCEAMYIAFSYSDTLITCSSITISCHSATRMTPIGASAVQTFLETEVGPSTIQDQPIQSVDFIPETVISANNILLENPDLEVEVLQSCWGQYEWCQHFELPCMGQGVV